MNYVLTLSELESNDSRSPGERIQRRFLCPLCGANKPRDAAHRSLCMNSNTGAWICHRCGEKGLLKDYWNDDRVNSLQDRAAIHRVPRHSALYIKDTTPDFDWRKVWCDSSRLCGTPGESYIQRRGIPSIFAESNGVRFSAAWFRRPAVLFPVKDKNGDLVAVFGRYIDVRYGLRIKAAGRKSLGVFTTFGAFESSIIAIVEGPMDALSLALCGQPAIAMNGTSWPDWLTESLAFKPILIATDADPAGDQAAQRLMKTSAEFGCQTLRLRPHYGKDWNDALILLGRLNLQNFLREFIAERINTACFETQTRNDLRSHSGLI